MSRKKDSNPVDNLVEEIVEKEIEYTCPVRGKVKQIVKVKKIKAVQSDSKDYVRTGDPLIDDFPLDIDSSSDDE